MRKLLQPIKYRSVCGSGGWARKQMQNALPAAAR